MFERIAAFLQGLPATKDRATVQDDPRVAATALMLHVIDADGVRREAEKQKLKELLSETYQVDGTELSSLIEAGELAEREAIDLYAFTSVLNRHLDSTSRIRFIELMWEMVLADDELHELEDNIVWRVAELIGVDHNERIAMRHRVQEHRRQEKG